MTLEQKSVGATGTSSDDSKTSSNTYDVTNASTLIVYTISYASSFAYSSEGSSTVSIVGDNTSLYSSSKTWSDASYVATISINKVIDISDYSTLKVGLTVKGNKSSTVKFGFI